MNYYEHHIGDYAEATAHLSILEDGVYSRLLRKYYATERPLPADMKECQRLIGCRSATDRQAVTRVLNEFFECREDGWHQHRVDEELERFLEAAPEREAKRENEKERKRRSREHRARLFSQLRELGLIPKWDTPITELEAHLSRLQSRTGHAPVTDLSRVTGKEVDSPVTPPVTRTVTHRSRPGTASQSPVSTSQSPLPRHQSPDTHTPNPISQSRARLNGEKPKTRSVCVDEDLDRLEREDAAR